MSREATAALESHHRVAIVGPVGVVKMFLGHALGYVACRREHSVLALSADHLLKTLKHARLDNSHEVELRKLIAPEQLQYLVTRHSCPRGTSRLRGSPQSGHMPSGSALSERPQAQ